MDFHISHSQAHTGFKQKNTAIFARNFSTTRSDSSSDANENKVWERFTFNTQNDIHKWDSLLQTSNMDLKKNCVMQAIHESLLKILSLSLVLLMNHVIEIHVQHMHSLTYNQICICLLGCKIIDQCHLFCNGGSQMCRSRCT